VLSNSQIKHIVSLRQKKFRTEHQQFIVEGVKMVSELLNSEYKTIGIYGVEDFVKLLDYARSDRQPATEIITEIQLQKISNLETPNKVLAVARIPKKSGSGSGSGSAQLNNKLSLALDNISDPGNLGTIIRTAAWFGIENIICSENTVDAWNPKVVQATMGALFHVNIIYTDLENIVQEFNAKNIPVYATALDGKNIYESKLSPNGLIIIGSESHGVSQEILSLTEHKLFIPSFSKGAAESLNAAVAAGVVCAEFRRGR